MKKIGVVVTAHGHSGIYTRQAIGCFLREMPSDTFIVLYINEPSDHLTRRMGDVYPGIVVVVIRDQASNAGLTGTWNQGVDMCIEQGCETIILSNNDVMFHSSVMAIVREAESTKQGDLRYYGPVTNNPGPSNHGQFSTGPAPGKQPFRCKTNINGFFMVFPKHTLVANQLDGGCYFDENIPFSGNEVEWYNRLVEKGGTGTVVPGAFVYHYKLRSWRNVGQIWRCVYTVNTGGYEGVRILDHSRREKGIDYLYFTDDPLMIPSIVESNMVPFYIDSSEHDPKLLQRTVKTRPLFFLPSHYTMSIYIDANISLTKKANITTLFNMLCDFDLVCFTHPVRTKVTEEAEVCEQLGLESPENTRAILDKQKVWGFQDDVGLTETNILVRKHHSLQKFSDAWYTCVKKCKRDQISFDSLLWKFGVNCYKIYGDVKKEMVRKYTHVDVSRRFVVNTLPHTSRILNKT